MVSMKVMILTYIITLMVPVFLASSNYGYAQPIVNTTVSSDEYITPVNQTRVDLTINPNFTFFNETSGLPSYWYDPVNSCKTFFICTIKFTDGWNDYVSFALSTKNKINKTWSSIIGTERDVKPKAQYQLVSHMKLNKWATASHVVLQGFNETSKTWYQILQCPSGINGPLEWQEFSCFIAIPENITKIRPILNAGWSSQSNQEATTWYDAINILTNIAMPTSLNK
jgi:hypothetical protein